ncbi:MAG: vitamin K epoxide reductase family protein [Candidatus Microsaccharimonas sp.]
MFNKLKEIFTYKDERRMRVITLSIMLAGSLAALGAAFTLTLEKFHLYEDPNAVLSCSINIVLDCSTVMQTWQSQVFGFPNMVIGLIAYSVLVTIALAGLVGVKFPRWWQIKATIGIFLGLVFSYWLFFQSVYAIEVLCLWCLIVTASTTLIFSSFLHYNLKMNTYGFKKPLNDRIQRFLKGNYHQVIVLAWIALMIALVILKFGEALFA